MGVVSPNGDMYLLYVDIDPANQLWFTSKTQQELFFMGKVVTGVTPADYTFIQKDEYVRVNRNADLLYNANYLMYRNTAHADRWFFAYIKEIKWLSDYSSAISFETDVYQTWRWDVTFKESFIEREITPTDEVGEHLLDESLESGEYITVPQIDGVTGERYEQSAGLGEMCICIATTVTDVTKGPIDMPWFYDKEVAEGHVINNVYSGAAILWWPNDVQGRVNVNVFLADVTAAGAQDAIVSVYLAPRNAVEADLNTPLRVEESFDGFITSITPGARPINIEGFTPRNKKLLSYPYCQVYAHNGNGGYATYDPDEFPSTPYFHVYGNVNPMPQFKLIPQLYKGIDLNLDEAITLGSFPMCVYNIDAYKAWMAQNSLSSTAGLIGQTVGAGGSIALAGTMAPATGGVSLAGVMAIGSVTQLAQSLGKRAEVSLQPNQAKGNNNTGSVNASFNRNDFYVAYKTIRKEWAMMLDQYFTMYGYKVNEVKVPEFGCRQRWYYCKLINPNIVGPIPISDMGKLKNIFANGITLWNNHAEIGNYSLANNPIEVV